MANNVTYRVFVDKLGGLRSNEFVAAPGDLFYDPGAGVLRLGDGVTPGGGNVIVGADSSDDTARATALGAYLKANGAAQDAFVTINVAGQNNIVATTNADTLTLVAGTGVSLTTNTSIDQITITPTDIVDQFARDHANGAFALANVRAGNAFSTLVVDDQGSLVAETNADSVVFSPGPGIDMNVSANLIFVNSSILTFSTINVAGQSDLIADSNADTFTLTSGNGITITTNSTTDTITIEASNTIDNVARTAGNNAFAVANTIRRVIAQSAVPIVSANTTSTQALATITVPGGALGPNGWVECRATWSVGGTTSAKVLSMRLSTVSGFSIAASTATSQAGFHQAGIMYNRGDEAINITSPPAQTIYYGLSASSNILTLTFNTAVSWDLVFTVSKVVANDTVILEQYRVETVYKA